MAYFRYFVEQYLRSFFSSDNESNLYNWTYKIRRDIQTYGISSNKEFREWFIDKRPKRLEHELGKLS